MKFPTTKKIIIESEERKEGPTHDYAAGILKNVRIIKKRPGSGMA